MKQPLFIITITFLIASCGGSGSTNKEMELDQLLKQQAELNEKISALREEIKAGSGDNSSEKLVTVATFSPTLFRHYVEVQGRVDGDESVTISSRTQGTITNVMVEAGDKVSKGQVLATLDDIIIRQTRDEVETQYNFAKSVYEKQKNLWDQKIGSEIQYLTAKNNKEALEKRLAAINEQLDLTRIKSPVSGTVDNNFIKVGQAIAPGVPAFTVVNLSSLKVVGEVGESYAGKIRAGSEITLAFPDAGKEIDTKLGFASRTIGMLNRTFNVEVPLKPSQSDGLNPNMVAIMKISDYRNDNAMVIPMELLQRSGDGNYVMLAIEKSGKLFAARKVVKAGMNYGGMTEITEGLTPNDKVVTKGFRDLNDGQEIRIK